MLGIIGAMADEVSQLKQEMSNVKIVQAAGMEFYQGTIGRKEAVVVRSGIGKVNAAMCVQILADRFQVDGIVNTGIAGSLRAEINIGDMVLSTDAVQHDVDAVAFGYPVGQIPQMDTFSFPADESLVKLAKEVNEKANPDVHTWIGRVVSGDQFVSSGEKKEQLIRVFDAKCTEMEGAAIAHAAYLNKISCVIIRAISDKADNSAVVDYPAFEAAAIRHSVRLIEALVSEI